MVDNRTSYAADRNWIRDKLGRHIWVVAVRATFEIQENGQLRRADQQPPPVLVPEYVGDPGQSSLRLDSDLLYAKPCMDVLVDAQAHAPGGKPVRKMSVRLRAGPIDKVLDVFGDRMLRQGLSGLALTEPAPFVARPIVYEWAYGGSDFSDPDPRNQGMDERNPIGKGYARDAARLNDTPGPAIEYRGRDLAKTGPAGFLPLDSMWQPRRALAGTYDASWVEHKKPLLPDDYDELHGSCAPPDQRLSEPLSAGTPIELFGMTQSGIVRFPLPDIQLGFETRFGRRSTAHKGKLVTLWIQPDTRTVALVFQSTLPVSAADIDYLDQTIVTERTYA